MPLLAHFIFRNGRFIVSIESQTLTALNSLFEEMFKIISWSRCSGDPISVKCKVNVDSYKTCSVFKGREYSIVRIWWRPNCKLTYGRRPSKETLCVPQVYYIFLSHDVDVFCWFGQTDLKHSLTGIQDW